MSRNQSNIYPNRLARDEKLQAAVSPIPGGCSTLGIRSQLESPISKKKDDPIHIGPLRGVQS